MKTIICEPVDERLFSRIEIEWDEKSGTISGPDADLVRQFCDIAIQDGSVSGPIPSRIKIIDPYTIEADLAAVLMEYWKIPAWMKRHHVQSSRPIEFTAPDGKVSYIEPIH